MLSCASVRNPGMLNTSFIVCAINRCYKKWSQWTQCQCPKNASVTPLIKYILLEYLMFAGKKYLDNINWERISKTVLGFGFSHINISSKVTCHVLFWYSCLVLLRHPELSQFPPAWKPRERWTQPGGISCHWDSTPLIQRLAFWCYSWSTGNRTCAHLLMDTVQSACPRDARGKVCILRSLSFVRWSPTTKTGHFLWWILVDPVLPQRFLANYPDLWGSSGCSARRDRKWCYR